MSVQIRKVTGQKKLHIHLLRSLFLVLLSTNLVGSPKKNVVLRNKMLSSPSLYGWELRLRENDPLVKLCLLLIDYLPYPWFLAVA